MHFLHVIEELHCDTRSTLFIPSDMVCLPRKPPDFNDAASGSELSFFLPRSDGLVLPSTGDAMRRASESLSADRRATDSGHGSEPAPPSAESRPELRKGRAVEGRVERRDVEARDADKELLSARMHKHTQSHMEI